MKYSRYLFVCWLMLLFGQSSAWSQETLNKPTIGVCITADHVMTAKNAGFDFFLPPVGGYLEPSLPDANFDTGNRNNPSLPIIACNSFFPPKMKCVGPSVDVDALTAYAETVFKRAKQLGIPMIIFGSGAARKIPDGYDPELAKQQFVTLCTKLADLASRYDVVIALENLNKDETNLVNTVDEAREVCKQVNRPNFGINADFYHMLREREPVHHLLKAATYIVHCDIAEARRRTPPGVEGTDFKPYLNALKTMNYRGGIAVEARWDDFAQQAPAAYQSLKKQLDSIYDTNVDRND